MGDVNLCGKCGRPKASHHGHNNGIVEILYCDKPGSRAFDKNDCRKFSEIGVQDETVA